MKYPLSPSLVCLVCLLGCLLVAAPVQADDWPQWRGPGNDGVWRETGITESLRVDANGQIAIKWSVAIGAGYSQPTVAGDRVFVTDRIDEPQEIERVHCFDFATGKKVWSIDYPAKYTISYKSGPRAAVTIDKDGDPAGWCAYALGAVGHLHCLDAMTGRIIWKRDMERDFRIEMPRWGIAAAPIIEGDLVILQIGGKGGACVVALDKRTGQEKWRAIDDDASYAAPILIDQAGQRVLIVYTADTLHGLDPATGKAHWTYEMPGSQWPIGVASPVVVEEGGERYVFTTNAHVGSALLRLEKDKPAVTEIWRRNQRNATDNLHSLIPTPYVRDGHIYGTHGRGELRCLDLFTGKRIWESEAAVKPNTFSTLHIVAQGDKGDRVWIFNEHGELIIAQLTGQGYNEISRGKLVAPTQPGLPSRRGGVTWAHPAFAHRHVLARNDERLVCADLTAGSQ